MANRLKNMHVSLHVGQGNFPIATIRVDDAAGDFAQLGDLDELLAAAKKLNPELTMKGLVQGIVRLGVQGLVKQIKAKKLDAFLLQRHQ